MSMSIGDYTKEKGVLGADWNTRVASSWSDIRRGSLLESAYGVQSESRCFVVLTAIMWTEIAG